MANGHFNDGPDQDGGFARINNSAKNGFFGGNDNNNAAPAGQAVGNGIFGFSMVPNASGVFGANNNGGVGVAGKRAGRVLV